MGAVLGLQNGKYGNFDSKKSRDRQLGSNSPRLMVNMCQQGSIKVKVGLRKGCDCSGDQQVSGLDRRCREQMNNRPLMVLE